MFSSAGGRDYLFLEGKGFTYTFKVTDADDFVVKLNSFKKMG